MALTVPEIISGAALLLAILSTVWQRFGVIMELKKDQVAMGSTLEEKIEKVKDKFNNDISMLKDKILKQLTEQADTFYGQLDNLSAKLVLVDTRIGKQEMKMELFWGAVEDSVKGMLKQPVHIRKDNLLDKFPNLDHEELCELKVMLTEEKRSLLPIKSELAADKKIYLFSLILMLAGIDSRLIDMEIKC
jgi:hypothetical protein